MTLVVDASVLVRVLIQKDDVGAAARDALRDDDVHAPELIDLEVASTVRRLVAGGHLQEHVAADALHVLARAPITRYPHAPLLPRIWQLRANITAYDAAYVALAETLDCRLVTSVGRLANAAGPRCPRDYLS